MPPGIISRLFSPPNSFCSPERTIKKVSWFLQPPIFHCQLSSLCLFVPIFISLAVPISSRWYLTKYVSPFNAKFARWIHQMKMNNFWSLLQTLTIEYFLKYWQLSFVFSQYDLTGLLKCYIIMQNKFFKSLNSQI